jgi:hypothetical protein
MTGAVRIPPRIWPKAGTTARIASTAIELARRMKLIVSPFRSGGIRSRMSNFFVQEVPESTPPYRFTPCWTGQPRALAPRWYYPLPLFCCDTPVINGFRQYLACVNVQHNPMLLPITLPRLATSRAFLRVLHTTSLATYGLSKSYTRAEMHPTSSIKLWRSRVASFRTTALG